MPFWRNLLSNALLFSLQDSSINTDNMLSIPGSPKTELPDGYAGGSVRGEKGISPGASGWHDGGGSSCTAGFPVCSCQSFIAVSGILDVFLKRSAAASDGPSACAVCLWAGGWRTGCTADAADAGLCAIWDSRFSEQLCRKRVRDAQMDWLQRGRDGRRLGTAGRRAGLYYKIRRSLSPGTELSLFESVHPPCRPGGNNSRLYTMQRMCWQGTVRKSADLCDGRRKQIS